jgi:hypothetical protein
MKKFLITAVLVSTLTPLSAHAQERMSDARYIAAQHCLAYADLEQLRSDPIDFSALREAVAPGYRSSAVTADARDTANRVRARAGLLANANGGMEELRDSREQACARFVERGLVHNSGAAASSGAS